MSKEKCKECEKNSQMAMRYYRETVELKEKLGIDKPWHNVNDVARIAELESELAAIKRPMESAGFKAEGMLAVGQELISRDLRITELKSELAAFRKLLESAKCPNDCIDGSIPHRSADGWEQEQCQWCYEKNQLLPTLPKGAKT